MRPFLREPFLYLLLAATTLYACLPVLTDDIGLRESLFLSATYMILAINLNLVIGYTGYVNFGNIVFFGLGGYIGVYLTTVLGVPLVVSAVLSGICVSTVAFVFGIGILHLRGAFFALATIGITEAVKGFVSNLELFGGASGMYMPLSAFRALGGAQRALWIIYYLVVGLMGLSLVVSFAIKKSKFGMGLFAIREDEDAAMVLGVRTPLYKSVVYSISGFIPAVAGTLFFFKSGVIQPEQAFDLNLSIEAIVMVMIGGQGTVTGAALGALFYEQLRGYLLTSDAFSSFQLVIAGTLLLLTVLFLPGGMTGWIYRKAPRLQRILQ